MARRTHGGRRSGSGRKPILEDAVSVTFEMERGERDRLVEISRRRRETLSASIRRVLGSYIRRYGSKE